MRVEKMTSGIDTDLHDSLSQMLASETPDHATQTRSTASASAQPKQNTKLFTTVFVVVGIILVLWLLWGNRPMMGRKETSSTYTTQQQENYFMGEVEHVDPFFQPFEDD